MPRQFPVYVLCIDMPARDVDVNVHPSKMNVKFANPSKIYDLVYSAIKSKIFTSLNPVTQEINTEASFVEDNLIKTDLSSLQEISIEPIDIKPISKTISLKQETLNFL